MGTTLCNTCGEFHDDGSNHVCSQKTNKLSLVEELVEKRQEKLKKAAQGLAEHIKPKLVKSAEEGYAGWEINRTELPDEYHDIVTQQDFLKELRKQLPGLNVKINKKEHYLFGTKYYTKHLIISWGE